MNLSPESKMAAKCKCGCLWLEHEQGDNDHICRSCNCCWSFVDGTNDSAENNISSSKFVLISQESSQEGHQATTNTSTPQETSYERHQVTTEDDTTQADRHKTETSISLTDTEEYQKRSYQDVSSEFKRLYGKAVQLVPPMFHPSRVLLRLENIFRSVPCVM
jgi:hypothetical protein